MSDTDEFDPTPGVPDDLEPGVRRILAPNPSPMTFRGTNTYLLGTREIAVIDPGPALDQHLEAILAALKPDQKITHIFVSHAHLDHSPLARPLASKTGAPVLAFGPASAGRSDIMKTLAASGTLAGGEGIDHAFEPDILLMDGDTVDSSDWSLTAQHSPGHIGNHLCFAHSDACFTADHVMGWATSLVSPPDGDLTDFMASCERLRSQDWRIFYPGHGAPITAPTARLDWLMSHRRGRERAILAVLENGPATAQEIARVVYTDEPADLLPAATRNVLAHLIDLKVKSKVDHLEKFHAGAEFCKTDRPE